MGQCAINNIGANLGISVRVGAKSTVGLYQVVIHDTKCTKIVRSACILGEVEVKAGFQPILVGPVWVPGLIGPVAEPLWRGF
eukprot:JP447630.1.p2 GENE.JP447630.1~~JP447630.1.p2  ORF type:complete len:82 (-),score=0.31 JP447630.1:61-306(-)